MRQTFSLNVNGTLHRVTADPEIPLLYVLRQDLGLTGPKYGCGLEQCGACKVLIDGEDVPSCQLPLKQAVGLPIITIEGLGTAESPHPLLQEAFVAEQAIQCGYCAPGMIIAAQGLLNRTRYPGDREIREALSDNICRCGVYERIRRAVKLRIARPDAEPIYTVAAAPDVGEAPGAEAAGTSLPRSLGRTPELDAWIRINADETVTIFSGKVEIGQGIKTALAQIAAEELDISLSRVRVVTADTARAPDEGVTAGSMSLQTSGAALRLAAAAARRALLDLAFEELEAETAATELHVDDGIVTDPASGRRTTYWRLMGGKRFGRRVTGKASPSAPVGRPEPGRPDPARGAAWPSPNTRTANVTSLSSSPSPLTGKAGRFNWNRPLSPPTPARSSTRTV